jgi:hypothetical protein
VIRRNRSPEFTVGDLLFRTEDMPVDYSKRDTLELSHDSDIEMYPDVEENKAKWYSLWESIRLSDRTNYLVPSDSVVDLCI